MFDLIAPGTTQMTSIPKGRSSSLKEADIRESNQSQDEAQTLKHERFSALVHLELNGV